MIDTMLPDYIPTLLLLSFIIFAIITFIAIKRYYSDEYACAEVEFNVNGETIKTMILRRTSFKFLRNGDSIQIYYDPYNPSQAFAKEMKKIFLYKPLRDCIIYGIATVVSFISWLFMILI